MDPVCSRVVIKLQLFAIFSDGMPTGTRESAHHIKRGPTMAFGLLIVLKLDSRPVRFRLHGEVTDVEGYVTVVIVCFFGVMLICSPVQRLLEPLFSRRC